MVQELAVLKVKISALQAVLHVGRETQVEGELGPDAQVGRPAAPFPWHQVPGRRSVRSRTSPRFPSPLEAPCRRAPPKRLARCALDRTVWWCR